MQRARKSPLLRSAVELGIVLGTAAVNRRYGSEVEQRNIDGGVTATLHAMLSTRRIRFDDNDFGTNLLLHPLGGLSYYGIPRANGASATSSFLTVLGTSLLWEQAVEAKEVSSINDHIVTPVSGWVLGESLFQSRMVFRRAERTVGHRLAAGFFGLPINVSEIVVPRPAPRPAVLDGNGLPSDVDGRFRFYLTRMTGSSNQLRDGWSRVSAGVETEVVAREDDTAPRSGWVKGVARTRFDFRVTHDARAKTELRSFAMVVPAVFHVRTGPMDGAHWDLSVGPAGAYELIARGIRGTRDQALGASMAGLNGDVQYRNGDVRARFSSSLFVNFAATTCAGAIGVATQMLMQEPSVLRQNGYYFGYGLSNATRAALRAHRFELTAELHGHDIRALKGINPQQDNRTNGLPKRDDWRLASASLGWQPVHGLEVALSVEGRRWNGTMGARRGEVRETGWGIRLSAVR